MVEINEGAILHWARDHFGKECDPSLSLDPLVLSITNSETRARYHLRLTQLTNTEFIIHGVTADTTKMVLH